MSNSEPKLKIENIGDLLRQDDIRYGTFKDTAAWADFKNKQLEDWNETKIFENMIKWNTIWDIPNNDNFTLYDQTKHAIVDDYLLLHSLMLTNCSSDYRLLEGRLNFEEVAFAMRKNHSLFEDVTRLMTKYGRDGDLTKWRGDEKMSCDDPPANPTQPDVIDVYQMKGLFTILYAAAGVALIESFIGWSLRKWRKNSKVTAKDDKDFNGAITHISSNQLEQNNNQTATTSKG